MKPKVQNRLQLGFYSRFEDQLNPNHPLYQLANKIDWAGFERDFLPLYCADNGRPAKPGNVSKSVSGQGLHKAVKEQY